MLTVCDAACLLYRERFLAEKYGPEVINLTAGSTCEVSGTPRYGSVHYDQED